jgi:hypothetical protein
MPKESRVLPSGRFYPKSGIAVVIKEGRLISLLGHLIGIDQGTKKHELLHKAYSLAKNRRNAKRYRKTKEAVLEDPKKALESLLSQPLPSGAIISFKDCSSLARETGLDPEDSWVLEVDSGTMYKLAKDCERKKKGDLSELLAFYLNGDMSGDMSYLAKSPYNFSLEEVLKAKESLEKLEIRCKDVKEIVEKVASYKNVDQLYEATKGIEISRRERMKYFLLNLRRDEDFQTLDAVTQIQACILGVLLLTEGHQLSIPLLFYFGGRKIYWLLKRFIENK